MGLVLILVILGLLVFWAALYFYKKRLTDLRDDSDFTTVRGQATIKACNKKLDFINGYGIFKRRTD